MKHKLNIKKFFNKILKKSKSLHDPQLMHPEREWVVGLTTASVLFVLVVSLGTYTYFKNQTADVEIENSDTTSVVYRESLVSEVLAEIDARATFLKSLNQDISQPKIEVPPPVATSSAVTETPSLISE